MNEVDAFTLPQHSRSHQKSLFAIRTTFQVLFGAPMPYSFAAVLDYKLPTTKLVSEVSLDARRFSAKELYDLSVIDVLAENGAGVLKAARELAMERADLAKLGVWGLVKVRFGCCDFDS